jgi:hypothetical protein
MAILRTTTKRFQSTAQGNYSQKLAGQQGAVVEVSGSFAQYFARWVSGDQNSPLSPSLRIYTNDVDFTAEVHPENFTEPLPIPGYRALVPQWRTQPSIKGGVARSQLCAWVFPFEQNRFPFAGGAYLTANVNGQQVVVGAARFPSPQSIGHVNDSIILEVVICATVLTV